MTGTTLTTARRTASLTAAAICALAVTGAALSAPAALSRPLVVKVGEKRSFARSELQPGAKVVCTYRGHSLSLAAPVRKQGAAVMWPGTQTPFFLDVVGKAGGAYAVSCGLGGSALVA
jgi:hypothetical protein